MNLYMCVFYDITEGKWYFTKCTTKKEAEYLMIDMANFDKNIGQIYVVKVVGESKP